jgi:hypothetical protein
LDVRKIEEALKRVGPTGAGLESVREMLAQAQTGNAACSMMGGQLDRAQRNFGEIHGLIRPVVAMVDGTQDKEWLDALAQIKALSVRYFGLRREFKAGDFSHGAELPRLLDGQQLLKARVSALAAR